MSLHTDFRVCWGTSLKMRELAGTIFLSHTPCIKTVTLGRKDYTVTCSLCSGQILLKLHKHYTQPPGAQMPSHAAPRYCALATFGPLVSQCTSLASGALQGICHRIGGPTQILLTLPHHSQVPQQAPPSKLAGLGH